MSEPLDWRPTASRDALVQRARALAATRAFFAERSVLEVDTPIVVNAPVTDVHIHSAEVRLDASANAPLYLHTSPEYAMKRLLAAGSGDIYQICHVVRGEERSRLHNPEFTLVEWYRLGFDADALMDEVAALVALLVGRPAMPVEKLTYSQSFERVLGLDPLTVPLAALETLARERGYQSCAVAESERDELLDLLMGAHVGPTLGRGRLTFVHRYPASQAALARLDPMDPRVALRFELYAEGVELANGFQELGDAGEQRSRFAADRAARRRRGLVDPPADERMLAALGAGLPECSGVAVGFDRVLMIAAQARSLDEVMAFPTDRA